MDFLFFFLGLGTGVIGTIVGAGGGFLLTPVFLFLFPVMSPIHLTALSLLAVCANSTSGSLGYAFRKQVHWPSVILFAVTAIPGVLIGVPLLEYLPRRQFEITFAVFLVFMSVFIWWRSFRKKTDATHPNQFWNLKNQFIGGFVSFFVGIISSLFGIGGGIVHVPLLSELLKYPIHLAAGTSHSILAITSAVAVVMHFYLDGFNHLESFTPYLIVGLVVGAQGGAMFAKKVSSAWILRGLGLALMLVALRLFFR
ncbi:MAG: sulfite exporter TauE/SafE family protein [Pseudobdellovibrionaceae bacterium]